MPEAFHRGAPVRKFLEHYRKPKSSSEPTREGNSFSDRLNRLKLTRRTALALGGAASLTAVAAGLVTIKLTHPEIFKGAKLRVDFNDVWDEVNEFLSPPTEEALLQLAYNPYGKIELSFDDISQLLFLNNGDSMNLVNGRRINSDGTVQKGSWIEQLAQKVQQAVNDAGLAIVVDANNGAQPGASTMGLTGPEEPEGNVQYGAQTMADMADDKRGEIPPLQVLKSASGYAVAALFMSGDDWRNAVDQAISYLQNDPEFLAFAENPNLNTLTDSVAKKIKAVLTTYKNDKERFKNNYKRALSMLETTNQERIDAGLAPMSLVVPLPVNLGDGDSAPYTPLTAARGTTGSIDLNKYPKAKTAAYRVTSSIYQLVNPELKSFAERTGITVSTLPLLDMGKIRRLFYKDGHLNGDGEEELANRAAQLFVFHGKLSTGETVTVQFNEHGVAQIEKSEVTARRGTSAAEE